CSRFRPWATASASSESSPPASRATNSIPSCDATSGAGARSSRKTSCGRTEHPFQPVTRSQESRATLRCPGRHRDLPCRCSTNGGLGGIDQSTFMIYLRVAGKVLWGLGLALGSSKNYGQTWPKHAVKVIVPFGSGGSSDAQARIVSERLTA